MTHAIAMAVLILLGKLVRLVQRVLGRDGRKLLSRDPRPPVVFLRSFDDDRAGLPDDVQPGFHLREEQTLRWLFRSVGPCVAVRRPGTVLPESGPARIRFRGSEWKESVAQLMEKSGLVVLRIGVSDGLLWEIRRIVDTVEPEKVVFYVDSDALRARWSAFREATRSIMPVPLPEDIGAAGFVTFDSAWRPVLRGTDSDADASAAIDAVDGCRALVRLNVATGLFTWCLVLAAGHLPLAISVILPVLAIAGIVWMIVLAARLDMLAGLLHGTFAIVAIVTGWLSRLLGLENAWLLMAVMTTSMVLMLWVLWEVNMRVLAALVSRLGFGHTTRRPTPPARVP